MQVRIVVKKKRSVYKFANHFLMETGTRFHPFMMWSSRELSEFTFLPSHHFSSLTDPLMTGHQFTSSTFPPYPHFSFHPNFLPLHMNFVQTEEE